ncbi:MAG: 4Fe-4S cluster-binding domain-containing protein [Magnetococcales bacterium]|nr:4Fe-4S cluster-binding domain-containing protein [Magnetococcales bacterium]
MNLLHTLMRLNAARPAEINATLVELSKRYSRADICNAVPILLSQVQIQTAYILAMMLFRAGSYTESIFFAMGIGGLLNNNLNEEMRGITGLRAAVDRLAPSQQAAFYKAVVSQVAGFVSQQVGTDPVRTVRWAEMLKAAVPELRRRQIARMLVEVATACQFDCAECSHGGMRKETKKYQMSLQQVKTFIEWTEKSHYTIQNLCINGPGEPFLWKQFDAALALFRQSKHIEHIEVYSNGLGFERIADETWNCIDRVQVSLYDPEQKVELKESLAQHRTKLEVIPIDSFKPRLQPEEVPMDLTYSCGCPGPMLYGDFVFLYCGPVVFDAAILMGKNIFDIEELYARVGEDYLSRYDPLKMANMEICRYCWANDTNRQGQERRPRRVAHTVKGGGWQ